MLKDFKSFIMRGNVLDMAVGIVIGTAFGKIVSSFVSDIIMPPIGMLLGKVDFSTFALTLKDKTANSAAVTINYGTFINTLIDFLIISFAIFLVVKRVNAIMPKQEDKPTKKDCPKCFSSIDVKATRCAFCTESLV